MIFRYLVQNTKYRDFTRAANGTSLNSLALSKGIVKFHEVPLTALVLPYVLLLHVRAVLQCALVIISSREREAGKRWW